MKTCLLDKFSFSLPEKKKQFFLFTTVFFFFRMQFFFFRMQFSNHLSQLELLEKNKDLQLS